MQGTQLQYHDRDFLGKNTINVAQKKKITNISISWILKKKELKTD